MQLINYIKKKNSVGQTSGLNILEPGAAVA